MRGWGWSGLNWFVLFLLGLFFDPELGNYLVIRIGPVLKGFNNISLFSVLGLEGFGCLDVKLVVCWVQGDF